MQRSALAAKTQRGGKVRGLAVLDAGIVPPVTPLEPTPKPTPKPGLPKMGR